MSGLGKLRPEIKALWVAALRSGAYRQGKTHLHRGDDFCCLGVLCDLAVQRGVRVEIGEADDDDVVTYDYVSDFPPSAVREWAYEEPPTMYAAWYVGDPGMGDGRHESLADLNDERGLTFVEIADVIEESL